MIYELSLYTGLQLVQNGLKWVTIGQFWSSLNKGNIFNEKKTRGSYLSRPT